MALPFGINIIAQVSSFLLPLLLYLPLPSLETGKNKSQLWQVDVSWLGQRGRTGSQQSCWLCCQMVWIFLSLSLLPPSPPSIYSLLSLYLHPFWSVIIISFHPVDVWLRPVRRTLIIRSRGRQTSNQGRPPFVDSFPTIIELHIFLSVYLFFFSLFLFLLFFSLFLSHSHFSNNAEWARPCHRLQRVIRIERWLSICSGTQSKWFIVSTYHSNRIRY